VVGSHGDLASALRALSSIVNVGQTFYGFGWESMLVEAGFLAAFLGPRPRPHLPVLSLRDPAALQSAELVLSPAAMNYSWNRLHLVNAYGAFGSIAKER
jgi:hypothetical protein